MTGDPALPEGSWTHSFEEDGDGLEVYRPTLTYPFPPSRRGRQRLTFADGGVIESSPGPDDRSQPRTARPAPSDFEIVEAGADMLRIRRD